MKNRIEYDESGNLDEIVTDGGWLKCPECGWSAFSATRID